MVIAGSVPINGHPHCYCQSQHLRLVVKFRAACGWVRYLVNLSQVIMVAAIGKVCQIETVKSVHAQSGPSKRLGGQHTTQSSCTNANTIITSTQCSVKNLIIY